VRLKAVVGKEFKWDKKPKVKFKQTMWYALSQVLICISHLITFCHFSSRFRGAKQTRRLKEDHIAAKDWLNTMAQQQAEECNTSGRKQPTSAGFVPASTTWTTIQK
jgi:hypothetical protein